MVAGDVWPAGLAPLADHVRARGMEFGLWFEPEMVNVDSDLFRAHPDWILATGARMPPQQRFQLVLDRRRPGVWQHVLDHVPPGARAGAVDYVKWDHNRDLLDAGSAVLGGSSGCATTRSRSTGCSTHSRPAPRIDWESCAFGGGRIDLGVLERTQRVWTSDQTDAFARQPIQRWTGQLVAPEYLGAHVSAPVSHQTDRRARRSTSGRPSRGAFGVSGTSPPPPSTTCPRWPRGSRCTSSSGRCCTPGGSYARSPGTTRCCSTASCRATATEALLAHVQMDESASNRGTVVRVPGLVPDASYALRWVGPVDGRATSRSVVLSRGGPTEGVEVLGAVLGTRGYWIPRRRPETVTLVHVERVG